MAATTKKIAAKAKPKFVSVALHLNTNTDAFIVALREDGVMYRKHYQRGTFERIANLSEIED